MAISETIVHRQERPAEKTTQAEMMQAEIAEEPSLPELQAIEKDLLHLSLGKNTQLTDFTPKATDSVTLHLRDLGQFKLLSAEQERDLGLKIFLAKLALKNLGELSAHDLLPLQQKDATQNVLSSPKGKRLLSELQSELKLKPKTIREKEALGKDASSEKQFLEDITANDQMLREKIDTGSQMLSEFVAQQLKFAKEGFNASDLLVNSNLRLAVNWAKKYNRRKRLESEDLISHAEEGLMGAADKFDYRKGYKFSTFAVWWIRQRIQRGIQEEGSAIRLPTHVHEHLYRLRAIQRSLQQESGREVSLEEVVKQNVPKEEQESLLKALQAQQVGSLDYQFYEKEDPLTIADIVPDPEDIAESAENKLMGEILRQELLKILTPRELKVISMRFGLHDGNVKTLEEVGKEFGVTRERIRQIEDAAKMKLGKSKAFRRRFGGIVEENGHLSSDVIFPQGLPT